MDLKSYLSKRGGGAPRRPSGSRDARRRPPSRHSEEIRGIMDWQKKARLVGTFFVFLLFFPLSPLLAFVLASAVFAGLAVKVDAYMEQSEPHVDETDRKLRLLRFLDAYAGAVPLAFRKRHVPYESCYPQPGKLVALFGAGTSRPSKNSEGRPFLRLTWLPPRRLSFWVAVSVSVVCGVAHLLFAGWGLDLYVEHRIREGEPLGQFAMNLLEICKIAGAGFSALAGFIFASGTADALRWAQQKHMVAEETDEGVKHPGYICSFVSPAFLVRLLPAPLGRLFKKVRKPQAGGKRVAGSDRGMNNIDTAGEMEVPTSMFKTVPILFPVVVSAVVAYVGMGYLSRMLEMDYSDITQWVVLPGAQMLPYAVAVVLAAVVLAGSKPYAAMLRKEMTATYELHQREIKNWNAVWDQVLPDAQIVPLWQSTHRVRTEDGKNGDHKIYASTFSLDKSDISKYLPHCTSNKLVVAMDRAGATGAVVEGGELDSAGKMRLVPTGNCAYMVVYYTQTPELGRLADLPHLKPWEDRPEKPVDQEASAGGMLALRLAFANATAKASLSSLMIVSAKQHHIVSEFSTVSGKEPVLWEIECTFRESVMTEQEIHKRLGRLQEALRCEWLGVGKDSDSGQLVLWMSNCDPENAVLKDEVKVEVDTSPKSKQETEAEEDVRRVVVVEEKELYPIPGGAETVGASPTRLKLIESQWRTLLSQTEKDLPDNLRLEEQKCWVSDAKAEMVAEATFNALIGSSALKKHLSSALDVSWLYVQEDSTERTTRISWSKNIDPACYLSPVQEKRVRTEAAKNAFLVNWDPTGAASNSLAVVDVRYHEYTKEGGDEGDTKGEIIEVVCDRGASSPTDDYKKGFITRSMGNLEAQWLRIGQPFGEPDRTRFSVAFSLDPKPEIPTETELGRWVYALQMTWAYSLNNPELFAMVMSDYVPLSKDGSFVRTRWLLPAGYDFAKFSKQTNSKLDRQYAPPSVIPGTRADDVQGVYLVAGDHIPADESEWLEKSYAEEVGKWNWERMMQICEIQTHDKQVPSLVSTKVVGRTVSHTIELPPGMGADEVKKEEPSIMATGNYFYTEIRQISGNLMEATTSSDDPLQKRVDLPALKPRPDKWGWIPLGMGIHLADEPYPGYSPFTVGWKLGEAPHMLMAGGTGSGKTSAMRVIAAEAISRGFDVCIIDAVKSGADFSGIYEYDLFCERAAFTLDAAYLSIKKIDAEVKKRMKDNRKYKVGNWYERPIEHRPKPLLVMIDEAFSMLKKGKGKDDETKERNDKKDEMLNLVGNIAREARAAGIHLLLAAQRPDASVIEGEIKQNLGATLLLGKANHTVREMMFTDPSSAPDLVASNVVRGRGIYQQTGLDACLVQTFWAGNSSELTENLRLMYSRLLGHDVVLKSAR